MKPIPVHWTPLDRDRAQTVWGCAVRVLRDSNQTLDIVTAEEITAQRQLRWLLDAGVFDDEEGRALLRDRSHLADVDLEPLRAYPPDSLGRRWVEFLDRHRLDPSLTKQPTPYTDDDDAAFLLHRIRQSHDLWHALLELGTRGHEEVLVHAFSLAQTGLPLSVAIVALGGLKHMVLERRWHVLRHHVRAAYDRGRRCRPLLAVYWERRLEEPIEEVRDWLGLEPMPRQGAKGIADGWSSASDSPSR